MRLHVRPRKQARLTHARPSPAWSAQEITRSAARGAVFVAGRQVVVQGINIIGTILLTRTLTTAQFGFYAILIFASQATALLGGTALALQAVRSPTPLSTHALRVLFTAQLMLSAVGCVGMWAAAPAIAHGYHAGHNTIFSLRLVALGILFSCFQTIPNALMERDLQFGRLAVAEILRALTFNVVAVGAAFMGWGIKGIAFGIISRVLVGALAVNGMKRWSFGLAYDIGTLKQEIGSGAAYFGAAVVSVIKDSITPVFMGLLLGAADVGLVSWANTISSYCVIALMMLQRLYIPTFARMAAHPEELAGFVTSVLKITNAIAAPAACLILVFIHPITRNIFGPKWLPAIPVFYFFWMGNLIVPTVTPLVSLLQALNRGAAAFYVSLLWMILTWLFGIPTILAFGILGAGIGNFLVQFSNYFIIRIVRRHVHLKILSNVVPFWIIAGAVSLAVWSASKLDPPKTIESTIFYLIGGGISYLLALCVVRRHDVDSILKLVKQGLVTSG